MQSFHGIVWLQHSSTFSQFYNQWWKVPNAVKWNHSLCWKFMAEWLDVVKTPKWKSDLWIWWQFGCENRQVWCVSGLPSCVIWVAWFHDSQPGVSGIPVKNTGTYGFLNQSLAPLLWLVFVWHYKTRLKLCSLDAAAWWKTVPVSVYVSVWIQPSVCKSKSKNRLL